MADQIHAVGLEFDTAAYERAVRRAERLIDELESKIDTSTMAAKRQGDVFDGVGRKVLGLAAAYGAFRGMETTARFLFETNVQFEQLEARLISVEGSVDRAVRSFDMVTDFARTTPFEVANLVEAFTMLRAAGIEPTTEMMRGVGNFAAAMGRDITDAVGAILRAAQGGTERLRESFFIPIEKDGDKLRVTWKGVTTEVAADSQKLLDFFVQLGDSQFGDGMSRQMETMAGAISNLKDSSALLARDIGKAGLTGEVSNLVRTLDRAIQDSDRFAEVIGGALAAGVNVGTDALEAFITHIDLIVVGLQALGGAAVGAAIATLVGNLARIRGAVIAINAAIAANPVGAVLILAGAIGGPLLINLLAAREEAERVKSTFEDFERLGQRIGAWQPSAGRPRPAQMAPNAPSTPAPSSDAAETFERFLQQLNEQRIELEGGERAAFAYRLEMEKLTPAQRSSVLALFDQVAALETQAAAQKAATDEADQNREEVERTIERLRQQNIELELGEAALLRHQLAARGATDEEIRLAVGLLESNLAIERQRRALEEAADARARAFREENEEQTRLVEERARDLESLSRRLADSVLEPLDAIGDGTEAVGEAFERMVDDILREIARLTIIDPLAKFLAGFVGGVLGSAGQAAGAGAVDLGQSVTAGVSSMVGGGRRSAGAVQFTQVVQLNVSAVDGQDVKRMLQENRGEIVQIVGDAAQESLGFQRQLLGA